MWFLNKESVEHTYSTVLKQRWSRLQHSVPGLRQFHHFEPRRIGEVECKIVSTLTASASFKMLESSKKRTITPIYSVHDLTVGDYGAIIQNDRWWLAVINRLDVSSGNVEVSALSQPGPRMTFTSVMKTKQVNITDFICVLNASPRITPRTISISISELEDIEKLYEDIHH